MIRLALLLAFLPTAALAADFEFKISKPVYASYGRMAAVVETTNTSGQYLRFAMVTCAFKDINGSVINIHNFAISKMQAGESRYDNTSIFGKHDVSDITCQPKSVTFD